MLGVSDTSPLNLLIQVRQVHVLSPLFQRVLIPPEVALELAHAKAPEEVRDFIKSPPQWLIVQAPAERLPLTDLDPGETAAISLAVELSAPLLIDERQGRIAAQAQGLRIVGAIGVLERAADVGLISDLAAVHAAIRALPFHVADVILEASLARHRATQNGNAS